MRVAEQQELVQQYFGATSEYWSDLYARADVNAALYQQRETATLRLVRSLPIDATSKVLEAGCGAGRITVALAKRGIPMQAVDSAPEMIASVESLARQNGVQDLVQAATGNVLALDFPDNAFDLVLAIGVLEWTPDLAAPLKEMNRVLKPGGHLIVNIDNARALHCLLDPLRHPSLGVLKRRAWAWLESSGRVPKVARPSRRPRYQLNDALQAAGFSLVRSLSGGFGPFRIAKIPLLPQSAGVAVHNALQNLADRGTPMIRWGGETYLTLSRKAVKKEARA